MWIVALVFLSSFVGAATVYCLPEGTHRNSTISVFPSLGLSVSRFSAQYCAITFIMCCSSSGDRARRTASSTYWSINSFIRPCQPGRWLQSSFTCAVGIACAFASVRCVMSLHWCKHELALVQAYSHVYCAICLLVASSLDRSALRCADRGRWHEQHLLSSVVFS